MYIAILTITVVILLVYLDNLIYKREKMLALQRGVPCKGKVVKCEHMPSPSRRFIYIWYRIWVQLEDGKVVPVGNYRDNMDNPEKYLPRNRKCVIYRYHRKYYMEDLYKASKHYVADYEAKQYPAAKIMELDEDERKEAEYYRHKAVDSAGREYIVPWERKIRLSEGAYTIWQDVRISAPYAVSAKSLGVNHKLYEYVKDIEENHSDMGKAELLENLRTHIAEWIQEADEDVEVKEITIVVEPIEEQEETPDNYHDMEEYQKYPSFYDNQQ